MPTAREYNRGPAAAAENRRALLASARRLFATEGYHVPLSAVARDAGVGQGSLYRHFPTRRDLADAIFAENMAELEELVATRSGPDDFLVVWGRVLGLMIEASGFVTVLTSASDAALGRRLSDQLGSLLDGPLSRAQAAGLVDPGLSTADVLLVLAMTYGAIASEESVASRRRVAGRALELVGAGLELVDPNSPRAGTRRGRNPGAPKEARHE